MNSLHCGVTGGFPGLYKAWANFLSFTEVGLKFPGVHVYFGVADVHLFHCNLMGFQTKP